MENYPNILPDKGIGEEAAFEQLCLDMNLQSAMLGSQTAFAHMDPPVPDIAAKLTGLNAQYNQNLLHPDLSPFATKIERRVIDWIVPAFGMSAGHMCAGSSTANLTAIWAAREAGAKRVVTSSDAHISVAKAAHILGMPFEVIPVDEVGRIYHSRMDNLDDACLVLTAGTTGRGVVDRLETSKTLWTHIDAAWAGPLRFTKFSDRLDGIETADSVAISAHKWFYQPKDSAMILFQNQESQKLVSFGADYLTVPNVGVQGSRSAAAIPLLATLLALGRDGLAQRIEKNMQDASSLAVFLDEHKGATLKQMPETAVLNWRPKTNEIKAVIEALGETVSSTKIDGELWLRNVAANPHADIDLICTRIDEALS